MNLSSRFLIVALLLVVSTSPATAKRSLRTLKHDVETAGHRFVAAFNRGDAEQMRRLYTRDAVLAAPGSAPVRGRARIVRSYRLFFSIVLRLRARTTSIRRRPDGRFVQRGHYAMLERDGRTVRGRFIFVWRRSGSRFLLERDQAIPTGTTSGPPGQRVRDVRVALQRYVTVLNRRDASRLGRFYAADAVVDYMAMPRARGRRHVVRLFDGLFRGELRGARVSRVVVAPLGGGTYESRGRYTATLAADDGVREVAGAFRFVWKFDGPGPLPFIVEEATELDE